MSESVCVCARARLRASSSKSCVITHESAEKTYELHVDHARAERGSEGLDAWSVLNMVARVYPCLQRDFFVSGAYARASVRRGKQAVAGTQRQGPAIIFGRLL